MLEEIVDNYLCTVSGGCLKSRTKPDMKDNPFCEPGAPELADGDYMIWIYHTGSSNPLAEDENKRFSQRMGNFPEGCSLYRSTKTGHTGIAIPEIVPEGYSARHITRKPKPKTPEVKLNRPDESGESKLAVA
jgi:hypothetical protein